MTTPGQGWGNPVVGGTALRIPAINSPNFNLVNPAASPTPSWAILQSGLAYFFGLVLSGGTITGPDYIINTSGIFIYSGTPALGNLIGSWAGVAGTDAFGNTYPQGFNITQGSISGTVFNGTNFIINTSGIFLYSAAPALGNLLMSAARISGTDSFGNVYQSGWAYYGTGAGWARLSDAGGNPGVIFQPPSAAHLTSAPEFATATFNPGAANEQYLTQVLSGKAGQRDATLQLFCESFDATIAPKALIEFGGVVSAVFNPGQLVLQGVASPSVVLGPSTATHVTVQPQFNAQPQNAAAANEQMLTFFTSGKESALDDAAVQLFSESADATIPARAVLEFGGAVQMEVDKTRVILHAQGSTPAQSAGNAVLYASGSGGHNVVDGLDGQAYATQRRTLILANNTNLAAAPGTTIFSTTVGVRSYLVKGTVFVTISNANQQLSINIAPPAGTGHADTYLARAAVITATDFNLNALTGLGGAASLLVGQTWICRFETIMNVTGAGTCNIIFAGTNANDIAVLANSWCSFEVI